MTSDQRTGLEIPNFRLRLLPPQKQKRTWKGSRRGTLPLGQPSVPGTQGRFPGKQGYFLSLFCILHLNIRKIPGTLAARTLFVPPAGVPRIFLISTPNMTGRRFHRTMEMIPPPAPGSLKALLFPPLLKNLENKGMQGGTSEVRRGTSSIHFHCPVPRSSSHIGHGFPEKRLPLRAENIISLIRSQVCNVKINFVTGQINSKTTMRCNPMSALYAF